MPGSGSAPSQAATFHAAALRQLAHFWPLAHGEPLPRVLDSKIPLVAPLARSLPGGYAFTPAKDLTDEIEWAKNRRIGPGAYVAQAAAAGRQPPVPPDLFASLYRRYEQAKQRAGRIDFEDMLTRAVELYETDAGAIGLVRKRYAWFSVDEYQDTNPLQEALLRLWVGDRRDLCVVGDPDQTIYTFTGASADYLTDFADRWPGAHTVRLTTNYRSTPQVLALANRLIAGKGLTSVAAAGPEPEIVTHRSGEAELAAIVAAVPRLLSQGVAASEIAILVRTNAQLVPVEAALTRAGLPFTVRGTRFHARPEVRAARLALRRTDAGGGSLTDVIAARWRTELGVDVEIEPDTAAGAEARERHASLVTLFAIARELEFSDASASVATFLAELDRRDAAEESAAADGSGITLSTLHRAKGLEWDAVFLPMLEEGGLPIRQALDDPARAGRGATAALRRDHARTDPPRAVVGREPGERQGPADAGKAVPLPGAAPRRRGGRAGPQRIRADRAGPRLRDRRPRQPRAPRCGNGERRHPEQRERPLRQRCDRQPVALVARPRRRGADGAGGPGAPRRAHGVAARALAG